jgi:hypothetical protein
MILFLDISSSSTGYALAELDLQTTIASIYEIGFIKLYEGAPAGYKYNIIRNLVLNDFYIKGVDIIVAEEYFINMKNRCGCLVVPELHGALKSACFEVSPSISWQYSKVTEWKKGLTGKARIKGIKGKEEKKRIETKVRELYDLPEIVINPITHKENKVPDDIYDVLGILTHFYIQSGATKILLKDAVPKGLYLGYEYKKKKMCMKED